VGGGGLGAVEKAHLAVEGSGGKENAGRKAQHGAVGKEKLTRFQGRRGNNEKHRDRKHATDKKTTK